MPPSVPPNTTEPDAIPQLPGYSINNRTHIAFPKNRPECPRASPRLGQSGSRSALQEDASNCLTTFKDLEQSKSRPATGARNKRDPTLQEVLKMMQPSHISPPLSLAFASTAEAPPSSSRSFDTSRLDYNRDYYNELRVSARASKAHICHAFQAMTPVTSSLKDAYEILTDDFLRYIYDDARNVMYLVATGYGTKKPEPEMREPEKKELEKTELEKTELEKMELERKELAKEALEKSKPKMRLYVEYYKILGVQPRSTTTADSIKRAFNHKMKLQGALSVNQQEDVLEAFAILSHRDLRREYDRRCCVPQPYGKYGKRERMRRR